MSEIPERNPQPIATAIVSRPGVLQQSLRVSLAACPEIVVVASLGDGLTALNHVVAHELALLVIDCNLLDQEVEALLAGVKLRQLPVRCLVLTHSPRQAAWALACGADAALPRDGSFQEFETVVAQLNSMQA